MNNKKIAFITGFAGMVGSHLGDYLFENTDFDIVGFIRWQENLENIEHFFNTINSNKRIKLIYGDINDSASIDEAISFTKPDYVFHLAAQSYPLTSFTSPQETLNTNIIGTEKLLSACKKYIPDAQVDILSNGIKYSDFEYVKRIVLLQHPHLMFAVSLYADTDSEHNDIVQAKGFHKTIQGIYNLALFNQRVEIRVVIHNLNYKRLLRLAEFIYHNFPFTYHIAFMGMETIELAEKNIGQIWIDPHDYMPQLKDAVLYLEQRNMNVSVYNLQLCILPEVLWQHAVKSISSWKNIYLDECKECDLRNDCGGFFFSSRNRHSEYIRPLEK